MPEQSEGEPVGKQLTNFRRWRRRTERGEGGGKRGLSLQDGAQKGEDFLDTLSGY